MCTWADVSVAMRPASLPPQVPVMSVIGAPVLEQAIAIAAVTANEISIIWVRMSEA
jgi:hypothetical protein